MEAAFRELAKVRLSIVDTYPIVPTSFTAPHAARQRILQPKYLLAWMVVCGARTLPMRTGSTPVAKAIFR
jgi:hypothetical protein